MELKIKVDSKRVFSKIGLSMVVTMMLVNIIQGIFVSVINMIDPILLTREWMNYLAIAVSFYLIGFPVFYLMVKKLPEVEKREIKKLKVSKVISLFFISYALVYITNIITNLIMMLIATIKGSSVVNPLVTVVGSSNWIWTLLFVGIIAPIIEEIMFRGVMLNKIRGYGDSVAIVTTAVIFGLFHGNFSQFFYAVALGLVFAYVTLKTGTIKYSIILHMGVNILGSVISPAVVGDGSNLQRIGILGMIMLIIVIIGIVLLIKNKKNVYLSPGEIQIEKMERFKIIWFNPGMLIYAVLSLAGMIYILII